jgi:nitronate monooxygenase
MNVKQTYLNSGQSDLVIIKSPVGMLGRAFKNNFLEDVFQGKRKPFTCPFHCITTCDVINSPYCIALALINAQRGNLQQGFAFSGTNGYLAKQIVSVKELINSLVAEYAQAVNPAFC